MIGIVAVHGVWNHRRGQTPTAAAQHLALEWANDLSSGPFGLLPDDVVISGAYYAHRLRPVGRQSGEEDVDEISPLAQALARQWFEHIEPTSTANQGTASRNLRQDLTRFALRSGLNGALLRRGTAALFGEVARYLDSDTSARVLARTEVANAIAAADRLGPTIVIAHSLGSVVAYETLHAYPQLTIDHLITVGSPLALPHAVFHRLSPAPQPRGTRPPNTRRWTNIADKGDLVAVPARGVRDNFDGVDTDTETAIHPLDFHTVSNYLRTEALAEAIRQTIDASIRRL